MFDIFFDENVNKAIGDGLARRGVKIITPWENNRLGLSDFDQLDYANRNKLILFTHDDDLLKLCSNFFKQKQQFSGLIYCRQKKYKIGECVNKIYALEFRFDFDEMKNRIIFL